MYQQKIIESLAAPTPRDYTPEFALRREAQGWRLCDGDTAVAFLYPTFFDIWQFSPFEPPVMANTQTAGKVVDLHTLHNSYLNLALHGWPRHWCDADTPFGDWVEWHWRQDAGPEVEAEIRASFDAGERIQWRLQVTYDPVWARYRYRIGIDAWKLRPDGMEPLNMMLAGALASRPEQRRWTHSVWEAPDGQLRRIVHSNALFHCTDFGSEELGAQWRSRNAPFHGAWVAYAAHDEFNPGVLIQRTNVPVRLAICSQLFDEHIIWCQAGQENLDADGLFHFSMDTEFVNLGAGLARELLDHAVDPIAPDAWRYELQALPFRMDEVNSFETAVDLWAPEDCPILGLPKTGDGAISWASDEAHTGERSIRLQARLICERRELHPVGAVCNVKPHHRYRLDGWIKTSGVERFARLELTAYEYTFANTIDLAASPSVTGTADWTHVEAVLDSGDEAYLMPKFVLYGPGTAWFDDVRLEQTD